MTEQSVVKQIGPYLCNKVIGSGSQSVVYLARHKDNDETVVLRAMAVTVKDVDSAITECKDVLAEISEIYAPNILTVKDYGNDGTILYVVMDLMPGGTLKKRFARRLLEAGSTGEPRLPSPHEVLAMLYRLADALDAIHITGMIHGQIDPSAIMFDELGQAYLAEIGFTRLTKILYKLETTNSFNMNKYSAPELWEGERPSPATDQYALACIIYELLTGRAPFDDSSIFRLMQAHTNDVATPPHYVRPDLPGDLAMVFWQALAKPVDRRFASVMAFHDELEQALMDYQSEETDFYTFELG